MRRFAQVLLDEGLNLMKVQGRKHLFSKVYCSDSMQEFSSLVHGSFLLSTYLQENQGVH